MDAMEACTEDKSDDDPLSLAFSRLAVTSETIAENRSRLDRIRDLPDDLILLILEFRLKFRRAIRIQRAYRAFCLKFGRMIWIGLAMQGPMMQSGLSGARTAHPMPTIVRN